jgi:hypothetical protein
MTESIDDISSLPGREIKDQEEQPLGEVKAIYTTEDGFPMWVSVEVKTGMTTKDTVYLPLARLKVEKDEVQVPYSKEHMLDAPKPDDDDRISAECDREMRIYYGIGTADQEMWDDNKGYATLVPDEFGEAERVDDPDDVETPDADKRTEETHKRVHEPGASEMRDVSADEVMDEQGPDEQEQAD